MKKVWKMVSVLFLVGLLFTGCTPKEDKADETQDQSGAPMKENESSKTQDQSGEPIIDYEVPDKVKDYDFDYEFVPDGE